MMKPAVGEGKWQTILDVEAEAIVCCRCDLCYGRTHVVFGKGPPDARIMVVGEGPGRDEDREGRPFVGSAGKQLDRVLELAGLKREDIWVTNIVRCRPTRIENDVVRNRSPRPDEIRACDLWMRAEVRFIAPKAIVCLGSVPARPLISHAVGVGEGRGHWYDSKFGIPAAVTYHPAYVRRFHAAGSGVEAMMAQDFRMARLKALESEQGR